MTERYLSARLLQSFGVALLLACAVFWGLTGRESALFVGAAITLIGAGSVQGFRVTAQLMRETPPNGDGQGAEKP